MVSLQRETCDNRYLPILREYEDQIIPYRNSSNGNKQITQGFITFFNK
jgi:hypothetical protein